MHTMFQSARVGVVGILLMIIDLPKAPASKPVGRIDFVRYATLFYSKNSPLALFRITNLSERQITYFGLSTEMPMYIVNFWSVVNISMRKSNKDVLVFNFISWVSLAAVIIVPDGVPDKPNVFISLISFLVLVQYSICVIALQFKWRIGMSVAKALLVLVFSLSLAILVLRSKGAFY